MNLDEIDGGKSRSTQARSLARTRQRTASFRSQPARKVTYRFELIL